MVQFKGFQLQKENEPIVVFSLNPVAELNHELVEQEKQTQLQLRKFL